MSKKSVKRLYSFLNAKWYDPLIRIWEKLFMSKAETYLDKFLKNNLDKSKTVLELGCGTAANVKKIDTLGKSYKNYTGFDFSPEMLAIARTKTKDNPHVKLQKKDITSLGDVKKRFDIILSTCVLSHIENPSSVVNEAQKLLTKNGKFFIIALTRPKWYLNFWMAPLMKLGSTNFISQEEINKFKNVKKKIKSKTNLVTVIEINKNTNNKGY